MKNVNKKLILIAHAGLILFIMLFAFTATAQEKDAVTPNAVVVNGVLIDQVEIDREFAEVEKQALAKGQKIPDDKMDQIRNSIIDNFINEELLVQDSKSHGIKVEPSEVEVAFADIQKRFNDTAALEKALAESNITVDELKVKIKRGIAAKKLIDGQVITTIVVPETENRAFYDEHPEYFKNAEQVKASHILIKCDPKAEASVKDGAKRKIKDIQKKLADGESFSELAKQFSEGPSKNQGGDLGFFEREKMVKPFADAAFALQTGEISDIVETDFGFHLIKVTNKKAASTEEYEIVKEKINSHLKRGKIQEAIGNYIVNLREKATIEK